MGIILKGHTSPCHRRTFRMATRQTVLQKTEIRLVVLCRQTCSHWQFWSLIYSIYCMPCWHFTCPLCWHNVCLLALKLAVFYLPNNGFKSAKKRLHYWQASYMQAVVRQIHACDRQSDNFSFCPSFSNERQSNQGGTLIWEESLAVAKERRGKMQNKAGTRVTQSLCMGSQSLQILRRSDHAEAAKLQKPSNGTCWGWSTNLRLDLEISVWKRDLCSVVLFTWYVNPNVGTDLEFVNKIAFQREPQRRLSAR